MFVFHKILCLCIDLLSVACNQRESYDHRESDILIGVDVRNRFSSYVHYEKTMEILRKEAQMGSL